MQDEDIYDFDETSCQISTTVEGRTIVPQEGLFASVNDPNNMELVTSVKCFTAIGYHAPLILFSKGPTTYIGALRMTLMNSLHARILFFQQCPLFGLA